MARPHEPREGRRRTHFDFVRDEPAEDEQRIHQALQSWARWVVERRAPGKCMSIESRYNPRSDADRGAEFRLRMRPTRLPRLIDEQACMRINAAMPVLPQEYRQAVELRYYKALRDEVLCRVLRLRPHEYLKMMRSVRLHLAAIVFPPAKEKEAA